MDHDKFRKICGLLGSDQPGEAAAAAAKATAMLKAAGLTWQSIGPGAVSQQPNPINPLLMNQLTAAQAALSSLKSVLRNERDAHAGTRRTLDKMRDDLKAANDALQVMIRLQKEGDAYVKAQPPPSSPKPQYTREAIEKMRPGDFDPRMRAGRIREIDEDALAREAIEEVLNDCRSGAIELSDGTEQFLRSVWSRREWTEKQREAVTRTLNWVHNNTPRKERVWR